MRYIHANSDRIRSYAIWMRENTDQNNSEYGYPWRSAFHMKTRVSIKYFVNGCSFELVWSAEKFEIPVVFHGTMHRLSLCITIWNRTRKRWSLVGVFLSFINKTLNLWVIPLICLSWLILVLCSLWNFVHRLFLKVR